MTETIWGWKDLTWFEASVWTVHFTQATGKSTEISEIRLKLSNIYFNKKSSITLLNVRNEAEQSGPNRAEQWLSISAKQTSRMEQRPVPLLQELRTYIT